MFKELLAWIWCFPQQILGLFVKVFTGARQQAQGYYLYDIKRGSLSLGTYIFLCEAHREDDDVLKHEKGHTKQSFILGWFYLPIIGVPSVIWAGCFKKYRARKNKSYYSFFTEKWADKLGGVNR